MNTNKNNDTKSDLELKFFGFFEKNLTINKANKYEVKLKKGLKFNDLALIMSSSIPLKYYDKKYDIVLNGFSIKKDSIVKKFLQQNTLFLDNNMLLMNNLSTHENLKIVSLMFSGFNLSDACLSSFLMKDLKDKKIKYLTAEQKDMTILSYTVCCPTIIWCIDGQLLKDLSKEKMNIFQNDVKIRIKHGGIVIVVNQ